MVPLYVCQNISFFWPSTVNKTRFLYEKPIKLVIFFQKAYQNVDLHTFLSLEDCCRIRHKSKTSLQLALSNRMMRIWILS